MKRSKLSQLQTPSQQQKSNKYESEPWNNAESDYNPADSSLKKVMRLPGYMGPKQTLAERRLRRLQDE